MKKACALITAVLCCLSFHSFCQQVMDDNMDRNEAAQANAHYSLLRNDDTTKSKYAQYRFPVPVISRLCRYPQQTDPFYHDGYFSTVIGYQPKAYLLHQYKFHRPY